MTRRERVIHVILIALYQYASLWDTEQMNIKPSPWPYVQITTIKMHDVVENKRISRESSYFPQFLCTMLDFQRTSCLYIHIYKQYWFHRNTETYSTLQLRRSGQTLAIRMHNIIEKDVISRERRCFSWSLWILLALQTTVCLLITTDKRC
jgi:hypothetical protein